MWPKPGGLVYLLYVIKSSQSSMILYVIKSPRNPAGSGEPGHSKPDESNWSALLTCLISSSQTRRWKDASTSNFHNDGKMHQPWKEVETQAQSYNFTSEYYQEIRVYVLLDKHESINSPSEVEEEEASVDWAGNRVSLLQTISNVSVELPAEPAADLAHNLHKRIEEFNMHSMEEMENSNDAALRNDEKSKSQRMHIYVSLLKQMAPEQLLATFSKDTFRVLSCKEMKIPTNKGASLESSEMEEESAENAVKGRVTQAVKKAQIQNTIPMFIELKRLLESKNSPLTGSLMECLRILLKDYKSEIDEMLVADKQLQKELTYDMQNSKVSSAAMAGTRAEVTAF
ncbi:condensin-2 complex subunit D3 [Tanacetum coccineum]